jgi:hypothetical protein
MIPVIRERPLFDGIRQHRSRRGGQDSLQNPYQEHYDGSADYPNETRIGRHFKKSRK